MTYRNIVSSIGVVEGVGEPIKILQPYNSITDSRYILTASFSSSVQAVGDNRYILTGTANPQSLSGGLDFTGTLFFPSTNVNAHAVAVNGDLILSSSSTSRVIVSGALNVNQGLIVINNYQYFPPLDSASRIFIDYSNTDNTVNYKNRAPFGKINFYANNSTAGSGGEIQVGQFTANSASFNVNVGIGITNPTSPLHVSGSANISGTLLVSGSITSFGTDLILSSSATSQVTISGTLNAVPTNNNMNAIFGVGTGFGAGVQGNSAANSTGIGVYGSSKGTSAGVWGDSNNTNCKGQLGFYVNSATGYGVNGNGFGLGAGGNFVGGTTSGSNAIISNGNIQISSVAGNSASIYTSNSDLILSSSTSSIVSISSSLDFPNSNKNYHIRSVNSDLILSSSSTSQITVSGGLKLPLRHMATSVKTAFSGIILTSFQTITFDTDIQKFGITRDTSASFYITRTGFYEVGYTINYIATGVGYAVGQVVSGSSVYSQSFAVGVTAASALTSSVGKTFFTNINSGSSIFVQVFASGGGVFPAFTASGPSINSSMYVVEMG